MRRRTLPMLLLPVLAAGCAVKPSGKGTLAELRNMRPDVKEVKIDQGLEQAMVGYRRFLEEHDDCRGKVTFLQIAPPSRGEVHTYEEIRTHLDELSGRINGEFAEVDWVPIRYVNQGYPREDLAGFYRASQIGLITPLRDGMNLVCMEFMAANFDRAPALVLSELAGASHELTDAVRVNPRDLEGLMEGIKTALRMSPEERTRRAAALMTRIRALDVHGWAERILGQFSRSALRLVPERGTGTTHSRAPTEAETTW